MHNPRTLGQLTARAQDRLTEQARITDAAEALLFDAGVPYTPAPTVAQKRRALAIAAAAAALLVIGVGIRVVTSSPRPLTATIDGRPADIAASLWVQAEPAHGTEIAFSDGSAVRLDTTSRTRFVNVAESGAEMLLEQGRLTADITHKPQTEWRFFAGPFAVRVTGTRFGLTWDNRRAYFSLTMAEGSVEISGPPLSRTRTVVAGETFNAWVDEGRTELARGTDSRGGGESQPMLKTKEAPALPESDEQTASSAAPPATAEDAVSPSSTSAPEAADRECDEVSPRLRLRRADRARRNFDLAVAEECYATVRRCHPGSPEAVLAAFSLGKIAFDNHKDWPEAVRWFERYLKEQRGEGPVREAMGRLMEAYVKARRPSDARRIARQYLTVYPRGPHAGFAASRIEEEADSTGDH